MELTSGTVCILDSNKRPAGTGFVVSTATENLIVTCAHVLGEPKPEYVTVIFQATGEQREAKVIDRWWRPQEAEDVAILHIVGDLPQQVQPFLLGTAAGTRGHTIHTLGFPKIGEVEGVLGIGEVLGLGAKTKVGQPLLQLRSSEITAGFSGALVWDEIRHRVIGMVVIVVLPDASGKLGETAFAIPTETLQTICPDLLASDLCPYRNLGAFTEADAVFFFGRQPVIDEMVNSLRNELRFLAVLGPSGSGKSSVVQAGLIPQLRQGALPGSDRWEIIVTRPTDRSFRQRLDTLDQKVAVRRVLVIDQFEELFVACPSTVQQAIITHLTGLLEHSPPISIILTLRDDFYSHFVQQEALAEWLKHGLVNIPPFLKREELTAIVREPARILGLNFEPGLVEVIVKDAMEAVNVPEERDGLGRSTILPLLEFTLTQLWERREEGMLTHIAYEKIGGVTGSLVQWATQTLRTLEVRQRPLARRIFTDLVYLSDESQRLPNSRKRCQVDALCQAENEREEVGHVVRRLVEARLLVTSHGFQSKATEVEIIHDALLQEWSELKWWLEEDRRFLLWHQECERRVQAWRKSAPTDTMRRDKNNLSSRQAESNRGKTSHGGESCTKKLRDNEQKPNCTSK